MNTFYLKLNLTNNCFLCLNKRKQHNLLKSFLNNTHIRKKLLKSLSANTYTKLINNN